jgi:cysteinyl-tRNA synthetase
MHNGFVRINDEKMSKSLGNFFTVREILKHFRAEEVRYFILTSHYRSPLNYDEEHLFNARQALTRFYTALRGMPDTRPAGGEAFVESFMQAMKDDFNTPVALAAMFDLVRELNRAREDNSDKAAGLAAQLKYLGDILGILQEDPETFLKGGITTEGPGDEEIESMIQQRIQARADRNWAEADRIRDELVNLGIILEDGASGTSWRRG